MQCEIYQVYNSWNETDEPKRQNFNTSLAGWHFCEFRVAS